MRFSIFTVSLPDYSPEEALKEMKAAGYEGVEWRVTDQKPSADGKPSFWAGNRCTWPLASFVEDAPRIRAMTEAAGLAMPSVGTYVSCEDLASVERAMQGAVKLGAPMLRVGVPGYDGKAAYLPIVDRAVGAYREVEAMAKRIGIRACIEMHMNTITSSASSAAAFVRHFDPKYVGVIHDSGNMVYEGFEQYRMGLEILGPYLAHVHFKNACWQNAGTRPDGSADWKSVAAPFKKGSANLAALMTALKAVGYDGWMSFEDFSTEEPLVDRIRGNIAFVKEVYKTVSAS
ncbi:MAG: sugar phosphate isomerase/epimerase [Spirochaetes bacterium]|nr:sugar phosphate isomerase/epimerase [Spirochaetota bacterium]